MGRLMKSAPYVVCSLVLLLAPAGVSPSEVSQYLIRTPITMMTYGVDELGKMLSDESKRFGLSNVVVEYDYETDRINIIPSCYNCGLAATERLNAPEKQRARLNL